MKRHVNRLSLLVLVGFIVAGCAVLFPPPVPLPEGTLTQEKVLALFNDHTVESATVAKGRVSVTYYCPCGEVHQLRDGQKRSGTWRVTQNGRICLTMEGGEESCRIIVQEGNDYVKYVVKKDGNHKPVVLYNWFKEGNPLNL